MARIIRDGDGVFGNELNALVAAQVNTGVESGCLVTQRAAGVNMSVDVALGVIRAAGVDAAVASGNVAVTAADATNPRYDVVVASSAGVKSVVAGAPSATPVAPDIPAGSILLALVRVPAASTTVVNANIYDARILLATLVKTPFDSQAGQSATAWVFEGQSTIELHVRENNAALILTNGVFFTTVTSTTNGNPNWFSDSMGAGSGTGTGSTVGTNQATAAWAAGDKLEYVVKLKASNFSTIAAGKLLGMEFSDQGSSGLAIFDKSGTAARRITIGQDSAGLIWVVTSDGATFTATSTGVTVATGVAYTVQVTFIKGTSVAVSINGGAATTVATTLPDRLNNVFYGFITSGGASGPMAMYRGRFRFTTA